MAPEFDEGRRTKDEGRRTKDREASVLRPSSTVHRPCPDDRRRTKDEGRRTDDDEVSILRPSSFVLRQTAALLVLEDGSVFPGEALGGGPAGAEPVTGEVVFNTSMTGYQEVLTDPSYAGQIVVMTYPLVGNYGVNPFAVESRQIQVRGFVVRQACDEPSHWGAEGTLHDYLLGCDVPGLAGIDTRALTRRLRARGVMMGALGVGHTADELLDRLRRTPAYGSLDYLREVSTPVSYRWEEAGGATTSGQPSAVSGQFPSALPRVGPGELPTAYCLLPTRPSVVVVDFGAKYSILRALHRLGCEVRCVPHSTSAEEILALRPDGIVLSPGPGDPQVLDCQVDVVRGLLGKRPLFGICLGHQLLARALGGSTYKLKFGHRGGNHPVKNLATGRVAITAQNHGYAVDPDSLVGSGAEVSEINLNDGTVEGLRHRDLPVFSLQYHPEASPGPLDTSGRFDSFVQMVQRAKAN